VRIWLRQIAWAPLAGLAFLACASAASPQDAGMTPGGPTLQAQSLPISGAPFRNAEPSVPGDAAIVAEATTKGGQSPHELSPWSMFLAADIIVKAVMIGLACASLLTWTVLIAKSLEFFVAWHRTTDALARIVRSRTLSEAQLALGPGRGVISLLLANAQAEIQMSAESATEAGIKERVASRLSEILRAEGRAVRRGMGLLATIGSTAPFVGLFGTVWGIMNSFIGISKSQTTNLAVVAPGIAEALLATAIGLVAAIPAVIVYNHFARKTRGYLELVGRAAGTVERLLSRDLDRAPARMLARAAE
jgi:biopolymer transport protein ExbB